MVKMGQTPTFIATIMMLLIMVTGTSPLG